jgi:hypothetical protein
MTNCLVYAIVVSLLVVAILFVTFDMCSSSGGSSESYACVPSDDSMCRYRSQAHPIVQKSQVSPGVEFQPVTDFLSRRQCYFPGPDYGQYTYAGCRCSRVGTQMNNGTVAHDDAALYQPPL